MPIDFTTRSNDELIKETKSGTLTIGQSTNDRNGHKPSANNFFHRTKKAQTVAKRKRDCDSVPSQNIRRHLKKLSQFCKFGRNWSTQYIRNGLETLIAHPRIKIDQSCSPDLVLQKRWPALVAEPRVASNSLPFAPISFALPSIWLRALELLRAPCQAVRDKQASRNVKNNSERGKTESERKEATHEARAKRKEENRSAWARQANSRQGKKNHGKRTEGETRERRGTESTKYKAQQRSGDETRPAETSERESKEQTKKTSEHQSEREQNTAWNTKPNCAKANEVLPHLSEQPNAHHLCLRAIVCTFQANSERRIEFVLQNSAHLFSASNRNTRSFKSPAFIWRIESRENQKNWFHRETLTKQAEIGRIDLNWLNREIQTNWFERNKRFSVHHEASSLQVT